MKDFKGTQGEWTVSESATGLYTNVKCGKTRIAEVKHYNENYYISGVNNWANDPEIKEGQANANLIAAAPELLKALKSCVLSMQAHPDNVEDSEFEAIVNKGWELINKALGQ